MTKSNRSVSLAPDVYATLKKVADREDRTISAQASRDLRKFYESVDAEPQTTQTPDQPGF